MLPKNLMVRCIPSGLTQRTPSGILPLRASITCDKTILPGEGIGTAVNTRIVCIDEGSCHSRRIYDEMKDEVEEYCELKGYEVKWFWLGAIFRRSEFVWTGEWHDVLRNEPTNIHGGHLIRIWRLKYDA